jgi:hypothetical protein
MELEISRAVMDFLKATTIGRTGRSPDERASK